MRRRTNRQAHRLLRLACEALLQSTIIPIHYWENARLRCQKLQSQSHNFSICCISARRQTRDYVLRLESRGWLLEDLEHVPQNYLEELDMYDEQIDMIWQCAASYLIGRQYGQMGL